MSESPLVPTSIVHAVLRAARSVGLDPDALLRAVELDPAEVATPEARVPFEKEDALWREVYRRTGDHELGVRAAELLERGAFRGLEYAVRASRDLREGLVVLERFARVLHGSRLYELHVDPSGAATLRYETPHAGLALPLDFALAAIVVIGRDATAREWRPREVRFAHPAPPATEAFERVFQAPLRFDQRESAIDLGPDALATPMREADPTLCAVLQSYLVDELGALDPLRSLEDAVRSSICRSLPDQDATLERVAAEVGLSERVLQKRLKAAGTSFQEQLDQARVVLARRYLASDDTTLAGAALLLGYSDVTAFHRAFKRWTGETPGDFRRRVRDAGTEG